MEFIVDYWYIILIFLIFVLIILLIVLYKQGKNDKKKIKEEMKEVDQDLSFAEDDTVVNEEQKQENVETNEEKIDENEVEEQIDEKPLEGFKLEEENIETKESEKTDKEDFLTNRPIIDDTLKERIRDMEVEKVEEYKDPLDQEEIELPNIDLNK